MVEFSSSHILRKVWPDYKTVVFITQPEQARKRNYFLRVIPRSATILEIVLAGAERCTGTDLSA
jgi:hypothetical protein